MRPNVKMPQSRKKGAGKTACVGARVNRDKTVAFRPSWHRVSKTVSRPRPLKTAVTKTVCVGAGSYEYNHITSIILLAIFHSNLFNTLDKMTNL